jgi:ketosteroid isomerase-like protein
VASTVAPVASSGASKPAEKPAEKVADKTAEKPAEKAPPKVSDKPSDKPTEKAADKTAESAAEKAINDRQAAALAQLERATANWAAAWSRKDVPTYLAFYARGFQPPTGLSRSEWEKQRHERLNRPGSIKVTIDDLKVLADGDGWRVTFRQHYRATGLESTATKSMRWVHEGGRWLIQAERAQ